MQFFDPKKNRFYTVTLSVSNSCTESGFCDKAICDKCPIMNLASDEGVRCTEWILDNPYRAAELMGYEYCVENESAKKCVPCVTRSSILDDAKKCVCGDRDQQYGSPENSFNAIASMWTDYLYAKGLFVPEKAVYKCLAPEDVAAMMVLFKMARVATGQNKADNWIDAAGYAACGGEIGGKK